MMSGIKPLLLLIDLQQGWLHKSETEAAMLRAVDCARSFPGDVVHCRFKKAPHSLFSRQLNWTRMSSPEDIAEIPEARKLNLQTYWRSTYSCINNEMEKLIPAYNQVFIAGVFTDISVAATAMDLFDRGIPVAVVRDCVATLHGQDVHHAALKSIEHAIGRRYVVTAAEIPKLLNEQ